MRTYESAKRINTSQEAGGVQMDDNLMLNRAEQIIDEKTRGQDNNYSITSSLSLDRHGNKIPAQLDCSTTTQKIGRASCRERV
jgi:hypothetical protein